jgi:hypothetical protein
LALPRVATGQPWLYGTFKTGKLITKLRGIHVRQSQLCLQRTWQSRALLDADHDRSVTMSRNSVAAKAIVNRGLEAIGMSVILLFVGLALVIYIPLRLLLPK